MIAAENLCKSLGHQTVLSGLSMRAREGEVTVMTGPNGAGKTTTLRIFAGLIRPDSGRAMVGGVDVAGNRRGAQRQLSFLPQGVAFPPRFACRAVLHFYAGLRGVGAGRIDEMLKLVGLEENAGKRTGELSDGMRQRLGMAVLLLPDAPVLMLDEPGLSLDPEWRGRMQSLLQAEARRGKTVMITTHLVEEWKDQADCWLHCRDGRIERRGVVADPRANPESETSGLLTPASK